MDLSGKVALITGGARMGDAIASRLADHGCHLALTYRSSKSAAQAALRTATLRGVRGALFRADLTHPASAPALIRAVVRSLGRLDVVVHLASRYVPTPLSRLTNRAWDQQLATDLTSGYRLALAARRELAQRGSGRFIFISDWIAASGRPRYKGFLPYYVAKRGVMGLTESLALELAPRVLVNAIAPGPILPPPRMSSRERRDVVRHTPLQRWGGAEEIAKAVEFLVTTDFVTGETLRVDGGRHLR